MKSHPFASPSRRPVDLADENGAITAADEIAELSRLAAAEWIWRHDVAVSVHALLVSIAEVGSDVATAEALAACSKTRRAE